MATLAPLLLSLLDNGIYADVQYLCIRRKDDDANFHASG